jgi:thiamine kinase-like enzyme
MVFAGMHECSGFSAPAEDEALAREVFARLEKGSGVVISNMVRLAGFTNRVYAVETRAGRFCLRIPGSGTAEIIDRKREAANARRAVQAGVAPEIVYLAAEGVMVTRFVSGAKPLSGRAFLDDRGAVARAASALRRLHDDAEDFTGVFEAFATVDRYAALLLERQGQEHRGLAEAIAEASEVRAALDANPPSLRPCHCDTTGANMLDTGEQVWLIDWEYSGMNDPMWDLAYLSLQADFGGDLDQALLEAYLGRPADAREAARLSVQQAACELLSAAWGLVQVSAGNPAADFATYSEATLRQAIGRMRSAPFQHALGTLLSG